MKITIHSDFLWTFFLSSIGVFASIYSNPKNAYGVVGPLVVTYLGLVIIGVNLLALVFNEKSESSKNQVFDNDGLVVGFGYLIPGAVGLSILALGVM